MEERVRANGLSAPVAVLLSLAAVAGCARTTEKCTDIEIASATQPSAATIAVGATVTATAGEAFQPCMGEPPRRYTWHSTDSTIATVVGIDSIRARITAVRPGETVVIPAYVEGGEPVEGVTVTVVP